MRPRSNVSVRVGEPRVGSSPKKAYRVSPLSTQKLGKLEESKPPPLSRGTFAQLPSCVANGTKQSNTVLSKKLPVHATNPRVSLIRSCTFAPWPEFDKPISSAEMGFELDPFYTTGWPNGSILRGYANGSTEPPGKGRKKKCPENATSYFSKVKYFEEIQRSRSLANPNEFYELLRGNALAADDADRNARIQRAQQMFLMNAVGKLRVHFLGWKVRRKAQQDFALFEAPIEHGRK